MAFMFHSSVHIRQELARDHGKADSFFEAQNGTSASWKTEVWPAMRLQRRMATWQIWKLPENHLEHLARSDTRWVVDIGTSPSAGGLSYESTVDQSLINTAKLIDIHPER